MSECAKNVIKGNVPLKPAQLNRLRRDRNKVRALALKKNIVEKEETYSAKRWIPQHPTTSLNQRFGWTLAGNAGR